MKLKNQIKKKIYGHENFSTMIENNSSKLQQFA